MYGTLGILEIVELCLSLERLKLKWWIQQVKQKYAWMFLILFVYM